MFKKIPQKLKRIFQNSESSPAYLHALEFARTYNPQDGKDYKWVIDHANNEYERLEGIADILDGKADSIIKYLGILATAVSLTVTFAALSNIEIRPIQVAPSLIMMLISIVLAAIARKPGDHALPLTTEKAFQYADAFTKEQAEASCAAMTTAASVIVQVENEVKADLITWAYGMFVSSILWLAIVAPLMTYLGWV